MASGQIVEVRRGSGFRGFMWFAVLSNIGAAIALTIVMLPRMLDALLGRRDDDSPLLFVFPFLIVALCVVAVRLARTRSKVSKPDLYTYEQIESGGLVFNWADVSSLYINPYMNTMILLFRGLVGPYSFAGITIDKGMVTPSVDAFVALVKSRNVRIEDSTTLEISDLNGIRAMRLSESSPESIQDMVQAYRKQTPSYMLTHWPEAGMLVVTASAVAVLIFFIFLTILLVLQLFPGPLPQEFAAIYLKWAIVTALLSSAAWAVWRYWKKRLGPVSKD